MKKTLTIRSEEKNAVQKIVSLQRKIDAIKADNILIYGAGEHTNYLFDFIDFIKKKRLRLCDKNVKGMVGGVAVEDVDKDILNWAEIIVISSFNSWKKIFQYLTNNWNIPKDKIVCLYTEKDDLPFYRCKVEMDADKLCFNAEYNRNPYTAGFFSGSGERYDDEVERFFFDAVMKYRFLKWITKGDKVVDIGAGTGRLSLELVKKGAKCVAVDTSKNMLDVLCRKNPDIETVIVEDEHLPFENESFDKVVSCEAMVHFKNWRDFTREHVRVIKPGGLIVYNMYNDEHLRMISDKLDIRANYMLKGSWCYATVTRAELVNFCQELGNVELIEMSPIKFFGQTAYAYGILTRQEIEAFRHFYESMCCHEESRQVVQRFENEIVQYLPERMTSCNMVVLRKKLVDESVYGETNRI